MQTMNILQVYTRFVSDNHVEELLFCKPLTTTTKAGNVMAMVSSFFEEEELSWAQLVGVCMNGASSMLGSKSGLYLTLILRIPSVPFCVDQFIRLSILGFVTLVKEKNQNVITIYCLIHSEALASKTLPAALKGTLDSVIQIINHIKGCALNTRLFTSCAKTWVSHIRTSFSLLLYIGCQKEMFFLAYMTSWKR